jgi:hypothetical protein
MGMFDYISISDSLPSTPEMKALGLDVNNRSFQTKDLSNSMSNYIIQDGMLFEQKYKINEFIEGDVNSKDWIARLGHMKREQPYLERVTEYQNCEINFYDHVQNVQGMYDCWIEYKAIFNGGKCINIVVDKFEQKSNADRLKQEREWLEDMDRINNLWYNKYFRHTRVGRWLTKKWYTICNKISLFFSRISLI